jgi:hypothetical protein
MKVIISPLVTQSLASEYLSFVIESIGWVCPKLSRGYQHACAVISVAVPKTLSPADWHIFDGVGIYRSGNVVYWSGYAVGH